MWMNAKSIELAAQLVPATYIQQGLDAVRSREKLVTTLLAQRRLPDDGWDDGSVELLLQTLSAMDSNNFRGSAGAGEREARVFSSIVARRHFYLSHGVGRSGDVAAVQPKAAGSSLMVQLANAMAKDVLHFAGLRAVESALVLPVATGMSLTLVLLQLKETKPNARYVIWPRIDQKSCFKSIVAAGLTPLVLETVLVKEAGKVGGQLQTDLVGMAELLNRDGMGIDGCSRIVNKSLATCLSSFKLWQAKKVSACYTSLAMRVVSCLDNKTIAGHEFNAFGAHHSGFPVAYVTFACALGMQRSEVDQLVTRLRKTIYEWRERQSKNAAPVNQQNADTVQ
ncbi:hypothetical protein BBO99_00001769 [Phytophthora kernoviae]|uniref:O-phosphoseryl-tRNA(Sec) selenium transferase n=1 Tax=Phytophthora kernoviae TaxID=325452 RepID=A0A3R7JXQ5_9STRA|nr:hypothetical protein BBI17_001478 [Phytophthora kernoviae]RLN83853.1 hypothetical protein BBO99_00001769 [Phytophthora kernoviae]